MQQNFTQETLGEKHNGGSLWEQRQQQAGGREWAL